MQQLNEELRHEVRRKTFDDGPTGVGNPKLPVGWQKLAMRRLFKVEVMKFVVGYAR